MVIYPWCRAWIYNNKCDISVISWRQNLIGNKPKESACNNKKERLNKLRELNNNVVRNKLNRSDILKQSFLNKSKHININNHPSYFQHILKNCRTLKRIIKSIKHSNYLNWWLWKLWFKMIRINSLANKNIDMSF